PSAPSRSATPPWTSSRRTCERSHAELRATVRQRREPVFARVLIGLGAASRRLACASVGRRRAGEGGTECDVSLRIEHHGAPRAHDLALRDLGLGFARDALRLEAHVHRGVIGIVAARQTARAAHAHVTVDTLADDAEGVRIRLEVPHAVLLVVGARALLLIEGEVDPLRLDIGARRDHEGRQALGGTVVEDAASTFEAPLKVHAEIANQALNAVGIAEVLERRPLCLLIGGTRTGQGRAQMDARHGEGLACAPAKRHLQEELVLVRLEEVFFGFACQTLGGDEEGVRLPLRLENASVDVFTQVEGHLVYAREPGFERVLLDVPMAGALKTSVETVRKRLVRGVFGEKDQGWVVLVAA